MLRKILRRTSPDEAHLRLYGAIVAQARQPFFYQVHGVPDTVEGRFDMIVLHAVLLMRRLRREGQPGRDIAQAVFDAFFQDMDRSLREMGVSDFGVPKRIKKMAQAFYGRAAVYDPILDAGDAAGLAEGFRRNIYSASETQHGEGAAALAAYALASEQSLAALSGQALLTGDMCWPTQITEAARESA